jgi:hypothetical protein
LHRQNEKKKKKAYTKFNEVCANVNFSSSGNLRKKRTNMRIGIELLGVQVISVRFAILTRKRSSHARKKKDANGTAKEQIF